VFEDGDAGPIAPALNKLARAGGLANDSPTARSDIAAVTGALKAPGPEPTARAA
jgi:hypothetical protein